MPPAKKPKPETANGPEIAKPGSINVSTMAEVLEALRRPFSADAVKWKVQTNPYSQDGTATIVAYIDARLAAERLNAVVPGGWETVFVSVPPFVGTQQQTQAIECRLKVTAPSGESVVRSDVGVFPPGLPDMAIKGGYSDALKRAAVQFGVGASMYALPMLKLGASDGVNIRRKKEKGREVEPPKWVAYIDNPRVQQSIRNRYQAWLEQHGVQHFGPVLVHGESADEAGDIETAPIASEAQAEQVEEAAAAVATAVVSNEEIQELWTLLKSEGWTPAQVKNETTALYGKGGLKSLTREEFDAYAEHCTNKIAEGRKDAEVPS